MSRERALPPADWSRQRRTRLEALRVSSAGPAPGGSATVTPARGPRGWVPDVARRRREYLWKKAVAVATAVTAGAVSAVFALTTLCALLRLSTMLSGLSNLVTAVLVLPIYGSLAVLAIRSATWCRASVERSRLLRYVPPVREQISALPADEVLVRASAEPAASPGELLRVSTGWTAPNEELVRPFGRAPAAEAPVRRGQPRDEP